ncbi:MAG: hypothetical protein ACQEQC_08490 [Elusimicrobiota bacterium]
MVNKERENEVFRRQFDRQSTDSEKTKFGISFNIEAALCYFVELILGKGNEKLDGQL